MNAKPTNIAKTMICAAAVMATVVSLGSPGNSLGDEKSASPPGARQKSHSNVMPATVVTNFPLGLWVGTWRLDKVTLLLTNAPFSPAPVPVTLELRIFPYDLDWNELLTHNGARVSGEFVFKEPSGKFRQWEDSGPITLYPWEIVAGPIGDAYRFRYILTKKGKQLELEMVSSSLNVRLAMKKISDEPPRPIRPDTVFGRITIEEMLLKWEKDYREWRRTSSGR